MSFLWFLSEGRNPVLDVLMLLISYIGTPFCVVGIITWFYYNVSKKAAYTISFSFYASMIFCQGLKLVVRMPRPWLLDSAFQPVRAAVSTAGGYSFPSIHTSGSTALYVSLCYFYKEKKPRIICIALLALVAFSRMYLGCHTPLDVSFGFLAGLAFTIFLCRYWNEAKDKTATGLWLCLIISAAAAVLIILDGVLTASQVVDSVNAKDAFETAGIALGFSIGFYMERKIIRFKNEAPLLRKILRFAVGIGVALGIEFGMKAFSGTSFLLLTLRYFLMLLWLSGIWPYLFTKNEKLHALFA
ncbi:MAG: phosphatase PAP2 family protein [Lachnospiraceae bacterium]|jgi:membrane-associated phospholipid phosphatase|nr:phosphatase PAP2 family protein [Lachnospiraceae bacterium]